MRPVLPGVLLAVAASALLLSRPLLALRRWDFGGPPTAVEAVAAVLGALVVSALVVGLRSLRLSSRNVRGRLHVYVWTALVAVLLLLFHALNAS